MRAIYEKNSFFLFSIVLSIKRIHPLALIVRSIATQTKYHGCKRHLQRRMEKDNPYKKVTLNLPKKDEETCL